MWALLMTALGALAGAEGASEGQLALPLAEDPDFIPLAVFANGDWIGRAYSPRGVKRAFAQVVGNVGRKGQVLDSDAGLYGDWEWLFVYMHKGRVKSVMTLIPYEDADGHRWNQLGESRLFYYPKIKYLPDNAQVRGAWIWWLYDVLNEGDWPLDDRWVSRKQIVLLNRLRFPRVVVDELIPYIRNSVEDTEFKMLREPSLRRMAIRALSVFKRLMSLDLGTVPFGLDHGVWFITSQGQSLRFHRRIRHSAIPLGADFHLRWSPQSQMWELAYDGHFTEIFARNRDLIDLLISADLIIADADFEEWLNARIVEGELLYDPEPFRLLYATEPAMMTTTAFTNWIGRSMREVWR